MRLLLVVFAILAISSITVDAKSKLDKIFEAERMRASAEFKAAVEAELRDSIAIHQEAGKTGELRVDPKYSTANFYHPAVVFRNRGEIKFKTSGYKMKAREFEESGVGYSDGRIVTRAADTTPNVRRNGFSFLALDAIGVKSTTNFAACMQITLSWGEGIKFSLTGGVGAEVEIMEKKGTDNKEQLVVRFGLKAGLIITVGVGPLNLNAFIEGGLDVSTVYNDPEVVKFCKGNNALLIIMALKEIAVKLIGKDTEILKAEHAVKLKELLGTGMQKYIGSSYADAKYLDAVKPIVADVYNRHNDFHQKVCTGLLGMKAEMDANAAKPDLKTGTALSDKYSKLLYDSWADVFLKNAGKPTVETICDNLDTPSKKIMCLYVQQGAGIYESRRYSYNIFKKDFYNRGAGSWRQKTCENELAPSVAGGAAGKKNGDNGCEKLGLLWYPKCATGYTSFGLVTCTQTVKTSPEYTTQTIVGMYPHLVPRIADDPALSDFGGHLLDRYAKFQVNAVKNGGSPDKPCETQYIQKIFKKGAYTTFITGLFYPDQVKNAVDGAVPTEKVTLVDVEFSGKVGFSIGVMGETRNFCDPQDLYTFTPAAFVWTLTPPDDEHPKSWFEKSNRQIMHDFAVDIKNFNFRLEIVANAGQEAGSTASPVESVKFAFSMPFDVEFPSYEIKSENELTTFEVPWMEMTFELIKLFPCAFPGNSGGWLGTFKKIFLALSASGSETNPLVSSIEGAITSIFDKDPKADKKTKAIAVAKTLGKLFSSVGVAVAEYFIKQALKSAFGSVFSSAEKEKTLTLSFEWKPPKEKKRGGKQKELCDGTAPGKKSKVLKDWLNGHRVYIAAAIEEKWKWDVAIPTGKTAPGIPDIKLKGEVLKGQSLALKGSL